MNKKISIFIISIMALFLNIKVISASNNINIKLVEKTNDNVTVDFVAIGENVYGILGTIDYDEKILNLGSCTVKNNFNFEYQNNKILVDDIKAHNGEFVFSTCEFKIIEKSQLPKNTKIQFKDITLSNKERVLSIENSSFVLDLIEYQDEIKEIKNGDISIIGSSELLNNATSISIKKIEDLTELNILLDKVLSDFVAYDIELLDVQGNIVKPNGNIKLRLTVPEGLNKENVAVYRVSDKELIYYESIVENNYVEIETDHFSTYVIGEKVILDNPDTGDNIILYISLSLLLLLAIIIVVKKIKK